jgi:fimbrial chaperone protein
MDALRGYIKGFAYVVSALLPMAACSATLQISPVTVELQPDENAFGITLRNPGDHPIYGQVRVFRWDQVHGQDSLSATQDLVASPPLIQIAAHSDQLIRLVRVAPATTTAEQSYRLLIDELPQPGAAPTNGVTIRLRYSVPVFVEPPSGPNQPQLSWHLSRDSQGWEMRVENTGTRRAQLAAVQLVNGDGESFVLSKGLFGYALAGRAGQWSVPLPPQQAINGSVKVKANVNSLPVEAAVAVDPHP